MRKFEACPQFLEALPEMLAGHPGVGVFEDDLVENLYDIAVSLREDGAHRVHVEIERPDETRVGGKGGGAQVLLAVSY
ncbi:MAG: hypothetical protein ACRD3O_21790 [Terriglobia bacterium]